jgi:5'-3' exonuclease
MSNVALIDGDLVAYRAAASCKGEDPSEIACIRAEKTIRQILAATDSPDYWLFLSGSSNFRYDIYPDYKANRRDVVRPQWLQVVREFLLMEWDASVTDGYEADDALGIKQSELTAIKFTPIICTLDKDLRQIPGVHYNWVKEIIDVVDSRCSFINFYTQLLLGDKSDNIPGFDGMARIKPTIELKKRIDHLATLSSPYEMCKSVETIYKDHLERNCQLLYIWRKDPDKWEKPLDNKEKLW